MIFKIAEFDNDYNALVNIIEKKFDNREEADDWCRSTSWTGSDYMVLEEYEENV